MQLQYGKRIPGSYALRVGRAVARDGLLEGRGDAGICHALVLERLALPGQVVLGTDSHTCQAGALGCLALGCGTTEMFNAWFTRDVRVLVPPTVRVEVSGEPSAEVSAKDFALLLLARPEVRAGVTLGAVLEWSGEAVRRMSVEERATLTNMPSGGRRLHRPGRT